MLSVVTSQRTIAVAIEGNVCLQCWGIVAVGWSAVHTSSCVGRITEIILLQPVAQIVVADGI